MYVTQGPDNRIRKITPAFVVTTLQLAGTGGTNTESASQAIDVTVASQPVITSFYQNLNIIAYPGCNPSLPDYTLSATASDNCTTSPVTFTQSPVPGTSLTPGIPINITLTATDASGSSANVTFLVNTVISTSDPLSFTANPTIFAGSGIKLRPVVGPDIIGYSWSPVDGLSDPTIANPIANPASTTTYTLTVTSSGGCTSSVPVTVSVLAQITVPTAFTPNGDGVNDYWNIAHLSEYPSCTVDVFNRGGQLIFHSMGYGKPWAGTYNGASLPTGTYYYIIDLRDGRQKLSGEVTIIR